MPTHFKLRLSDLTRRVSFARQPDWQELSDKISSLYSIPRHQVGVTYIDAENEEITLNTEEELQDYYCSSYRPGETIKFSVRDLASRNQGRPAPTSAGLRNTFGQFIDSEIPGIDDWQAINNTPSLEEILGHTSVASDVRSAFVESVASDGSTVGKGADNTFGAQAGATVEDAHGGVSEQCISSEEKGKERAHSIRSMSSTQSLLAADNGDKHPVHVYDVSSHTRPSLLHGFAFSGGSDAVAAESTPRVSTSVLEQDAPIIEKELDQMREFEDPPLPSLEPVDPQTPPHTAGTSRSVQFAQVQASASLAQDVASFLSTTSSIISAHPELGDSLRTIIRNATNGAYWASHRETLSQAAAELQRSTENFAEDGRRVVEEEAGRRVAEALSGVLRIFSQSQDETCNTQADTNAQTPNPAVKTDAQQADTTNVPPLHDANPDLTEPSHPQTFPMPGAPAAGFDAHFGRSFPFNRGHRPTWRREWRARASMPPDFAANGSFPVWAIPNAPLPFGPGVLNAAGPHMPFGPGRAFYGNAFEPNSGVGSAAGPDQNPEASTSTESQQRPSAEELKAKVEEAKRVYKAEKERYRRERDEKKMEKDKEKTVKMENAASNASQNPDVTGEDVHIAANARHGFPRFDIVNVTESSPRRYNTHLGHFPRRHERPTEDLFTRAVNRISKRLADMGFTEKAYPDLRQKIKNHLPSDGAIAKDSEDDIVTTLLEAMLAAPKSPVASGSGARDIPGGWH